jgi:hypothetical protein
MTPIRLVHAEACANAIAGLALAQGVLWAFGLPVGKAITLNVVMLAVSYARAFVLRVVFARMVG